MINKCKNNIICPKAESGIMLDVTTGATATTMTATVRLYGYLV